MTSIHFLCGRPQRGLCGDTASVALRHRPRVNNPEEERRQETQRPFRSPSPCPPSTVVRRRRSYSWRRTMNCSAKNSPPRRLKSFYSSAKSSGVFFDWRHWSLWRHCGLLLTGVWMLWELWSPVTNVHLTLFFSCFMVIVLAILQVKLCYG